MSVRRDEPEGVMDGEKEVQWSNWEQLWKSSWSNRFSGPAHRCLPLSLPLSVPDRFSPCSLFTHSVTHTHTHTLTSIFHLNQFSISSLRLETNLMFCLCHYRALQLWGGYSTFYISMSANTWCGRTRVHTHETTAGSLRFIQLASASHGNCIRLGATRWEAPHHIYDILWAPPPLPHQGEQRGVIKIKNQYASCKARKPHK